MKHMQLMYICYCYNSPWGVCPDWHDLFLLAVGVGVCQIDVVGKTAQLPGTGLALVLPQVEVLFFFPAIRLL